MRESGVKSCERTAEFDHAICNTRDFYLVTNQINQVSGGKKMKGTCLSPSKGESVLTGQKIDKSSLFSMFRATILFRDENFWL